MIPDSHSALRRFIQTNLKGSQCDDKINREKMSCLRNSLHATVLRGRRKKTASDGSDTGKN